MVRRGSLRFRLGKASGNILNRCIGFLLIITLGTGACKHAKERKSVALMALDPFAHPDKPTRAAIEAMLYSMPAEVRPKVDDCADVLEEYGRGIRSDQELVSHKVRLAGEIFPEVEVYHWFFYTRLLAFMSRSFDSKRGFKAESKAFLDEMGLLWLLAKALEEIREDEKYFIYLQQVYIEVNQGEFGRSLEVVRPSLERYTAPFEHPDEGEFLNKGNEDSESESEDEGEEKNTSEAGPSSGTEENSAREKTPAGESPSQVDNDTQGPN